jgi:hypothetical protein
MTSTPSSKPSIERLSTRTLLVSIVDYAGLFPPAERDMEAAAAAYHRYRCGEHRWMLGSFVVPAERAGELATAARGLGARADARGGDVTADPWPVSVIVPSAEEGARVVAEVARWHADHLAVAALEVRPLVARAIREDAAAGVPADVPIFHEVPLDEGLEATLDAVASLRRCAKVRTGGVVPEAFPASNALVRFVRACAEREVSFKATAGLHHAFRGRYPLTYEPGSACATMHGFMGLALVAALVLERGVDERGAAALLGAGVEDVDVGADGLRWRSHHVSVEALARARRFFRSFGSCSFEEPVAELQQAGLL